MVKDFITTKLRAFARASEELGLWGALFVSFRYIRRQLLERRTYEPWIKAQELTPAAIREANSTISRWSSPPTFSVIMPVYNTDFQLLKLAIESVRRQIYPHWELWLVNDASSAAHVRPLLDRYGQQDRIHVIHLPENRGISGASNAALEQATGDFIALLDHDDELARQALYENARVIVANPQVDFLYSDEDFIDMAGQRSHPFFKPNWSPDYFHACMYTCHLGVYRTALVRQIGGFRSEYDGAQDWDLVLRVTEQTQQIRHIPKVLYHWRLTPTSVTSGAEAKPWAYAAARRALEAMVQRSPYPGEVEALPRDGFYRVKRYLRHQPMVSIIIPSAGKAMGGGSAQSFLEHGLTSLWQRSTYPNLEVVVVDGYDLPVPVLNWVKDSPATLLRCSQPFNFSMRLNQGVAASQGEILLILNDDVEVVSPDWIESMLQFAQQREIGAVGARLLFPTGHIQHTGVLVLDGNPGHAFYDAPGDSPGYFCSNLVNRNYLGVTGACLMVRREVYQQVGGMDEIFPLNYNDVDFCLKLHQAGYRNVVTPFAELIHHESATRQRGVLPNELETFHARWRPYLDGLGGDPYYNPNLSSERGDFTLA